MLSTHEGVLLKGLYGKKEQGLEANTGGQGLEKKGLPDDAAGSTYCAQSLLKLEAMSFSVHIHSCCVKQDPLSKCEEDGEFLLFIVLGRACIYKRI